MEIFKIGELLEVSGYASIKLTNNESFNIQAFAKANGLTLNQTKNLFSTIPGLVDFHKNLVSQDKENLEVVDNDYSFLNETKTSSSSSSNAVEKSTSTAPKNSDSSVNFIEVTNKIKQQSNVPENFTISNVSYDANKNPISWQVFDVSGNLVRNVLNVSYDAQGRYSSWTEKLNDGSDNTITVVQSYQENGLISARKEITRDASGNHLSTAVVASADTKFRTIAFREYSDEACTQLKRTVSNITYAPDNTVLSYQENGEKITVPQTDIKELANLLNNKAFSNLSYEQTAEKLNSDFYDLGIYANSYNQVYIPYGDDNTSNNIYNALSTAMLDEYGISATRFTQTDDAVHPAIIDIKAQIADVLVQINDAKIAKNDAVAKRDAEAEESILNQQQELNEKLKDYVVEHAKISSNLSGSDLSDVETKLLQSIQDISFYQDSRDEQMKYLQSTLDSIDEKMQTADYDEMLALEEQRLAILASLKIFEAEQSNLAFEKAEYNDLIAKLSADSIKSLSNDESPKKELLSAIQNKMNVLSKLRTTSSELLEALQIEDGQALSKLDREQSELIKRYREYALEEAKLFAKAEGKSLNSNDLDLIQNEIDYKIRSLEIAKSITYLDYEAISITSQKQAALQAEDDYSLYVLEQQERSINSLRKIYELEAYSINNVQNIINEINAVYELDAIKSLGTDSQIRKDLDEVVSKKTDIQNQMFEIASQKAEAMQSEDDYAQYQLEEKEKALQKEYKELEVSQAKLVAKAEGRTLSDTEIKLIELLYDSQVSQCVIDTKIAYMEYKSIAIAVLKSETIQLGDDKAQYVLEQQENSINALSKIFESDKQTSLSFHTMINDMLASLNAEPIKSMNNSASPKKELLATFNEKITVLQKLFTIDSEMLEAVQIEDSKKFSGLEKQEANLWDELTQLGIKENELIAKANGTTMSNTQKNSLKDYYALEYEQKEIERKIKILEYEMITVATQKSEAMQVDDDYGQYRLEQEENDISNSLNKLYDKLDDVKSKKESLFKDLG